ncbi:reverse transcriptase [Plakobranchus ocellatus]|uniref:Reverse transcriptase n=1 Tax=Plakobranchus ocellatus TaxID=259542 RepID=A0AAV4B7Q9_9GAST|nr:reverse transcriptase [Plakobranchus ocellatus]
MFSASRLPRDRESLIENTYGGGEGLGQADHRTCSQFLQSSSKPGHVHVATQQSVTQLAIAICDANSLPVQPKAGALEFTSEGGTKSWCGSVGSMDSQRKSLLDGCFQPISPNGKDILVIIDTGMRPDIVFHPRATRQIMVELKIPCESRMRGKYI